MSVVVVGVSHKSAPMPVLERSVVAADDLPKVLTELLGTECIGEAMVISTCNRLEVYADVSRFHGAVAEIGGVLARSAGVPVPDLAEHAYVHFASAAAEHMMRVAAGLDSMVLGEAQILGQVRAAYAVANDHGSAGRELHGLVQSALHVGKRVHAETGIDRAGASVASVGLNRAEDIVGSLRGRRVVVVGAGSMGALVAGRARQRGATVTVVNRSLDAAQRLADSVDATALSLTDRDSLRAAIDAADVVVSVTGSTGTVLDRDVVQHRGSRPLALIDLALPRDVAVDVEDAAGVTYIDLDALRTAGALVSDADVAAAEVLVAEELQLYLDRQQQLAVAPTVTALRARAETVIAAELKRLDGRLPDLSVADRAEVAQAVRRAVEKLLHAPTVRVKQLAGAPGADDYAAALRTLFDLDPASLESLTSIREGSS